MEPVQFVAMCNRTTHATSYSSFHAAVWRCGPVLDAFRQSAGVGAKGLYLEPLDPGARKPYDSVRPFSGLNN